MIVVAIEQYLFWGALFAFYCYINADICGRHDIPLWAFFLVVLVWPYTLYLTLKEISKWRL